MANNRMFLVYRPTGDAVFLGKRLAWGWYNTPENLAERITELFQKAEVAAAEDGFSQDDFGIALEAGGRQPHAIDKWQYEAIGDPNVRKLIIGESVPYGTPEAM